MSSEISEFLNGPSLPYARFPQHGDTVMGIVSEPPRMCVQTDINGDERYYDDGNPMMMLGVVLDTEHGPCLLQVKGSSIPASRSMRASVAAACRAAGRDLEVGGRLIVTYVSDGEPPKPGYHAPKQYRVKYEPPGTFVSIGSYGLAGGAR